MSSRALVVDDDRVMRLLLCRALRELEVEPVEAEDGLRALEILPSTEIDVVLLDLLMPGLDGYGTLERIRADDKFGHIPVIVITGVDDLDSVVRCIELGATDYLPKPFKPAILRARVSASLAAKRLRDLELEYLEQVGIVTEAAAAVERGDFETVSLGTVPARDDALGSLARSFSRMADEVRAREARLQAELRELRIEIDEAAQSSRVEEITATEYFRDLKARAEDLRRTVSE
jgi:DNA-binding response OmpR family regulator